MKSVRELIEEIMSDVPEEVFNEANDARVAKLKAELQRICPHKKEQMLTDSGFNSSSGTLYGRVICLDCGRKREWNAY